MTVSKQNWNLCNEPEDRMVNVNSTLWALNSQGEAERAKLHSHFSPLSVPPKTILRVLS
jgi:hypothetical protein